MPGGYLVLNPHPILPTVNWSDLVPANANCSTGIQWIWAFMGQCVVDARGIAAVACGFICLVVWIMNGFPQMIENCRLGLPDQAISPFLLLFWLLGDTTNLIGCILTHQLVLQAVISVYAIASDLILVMQFIYYKIKHRAYVAHLNAQLIADPITLDGDGDDSPLLDVHVSPDTHCLIEPNQTTNNDSERTRLMSVLPIIGFSFFLTVSQYATCHTLMTASPIGNRDQIYFSPRNLFSWSNPNTMVFESTTEPVILDYPSDRTSILPNTSSKIGYTLGFISSIMYAFSRLPQIFRNWRRQSTEGLCVVLFWLAVLGNTSYALQIFLTSLEPLYLLQSLPWLIGSVGVMSLDFIICIQFYCYRPVRLKHPDSSLLQSSDSAQSPPENIHQVTV